MKKKIAYILLIFLELVLVFAPSLVLAEDFTTYNYYKEGSSLVIDQSVSLVNKGNPYILNGLRIAQSGNLHIGPGVKILLEASAEIVIEGTLVIEGMEDNRVSIEAKALSWDRVSTPDTYGARINWKHVIFKGFSRSFELYGNDLFVQNVDLVDGYQNNLKLHYDPANPREIILNHIRFINKSTDGNLVSRMGLDLYGTITRANMDHMEIIGSDRSICGQNQKIYHQWNGKNVKQGTMFNISFPCNYEFEWNIEMTRNFYFLCTLSKPEFCNQRMETKKDPSAMDYWNKNVPVIFVPGYGSSVNLPKLTSLNIEPPDYDGWTFFNSIVPGYGELLHHFKVNSIPCEIAYYDWRMTSRQIADTYLKRKIEETKLKYNSNYVHLVTHSFGGIISRSYIDSDNYEGDVLNLIQIGTPNYGAALAYGIWEAGEIPEEWSSIDYLFRFYKYKNLTPRWSNRQVVQAFIPSAIELAPIYPALIYDGNFLDPNSMKYRNDWLLYLSTVIPKLMQRTAVTVGLSDIEDTTTYINVEKPNFKNVTWPDGKPSSTQPLAMGGGDGTVPALSVYLEGAQVIKTSGTHNNLPGILKSEVLKKLYPTHQSEKFRPNISLLKRAKKFIDWYFDCPIEISIKLPNNLVIDATKDNMVTDLYYDDEYYDKGQVASSDDLTWFNLPRFNGRYTVEITGKEDAEIRFWTDQGTIHYLDIKKDQKKYVTATISDGEDVERFYDASGRLVNGSGEGPDPSEPDDALNIVPDVSNGNDCCSDDSASGDGDNHIVLSGGSDPVVRGGGDALFNPLSLDQNNQLAYSGSGVSDQVTHIDQSVLKESNLFNIARSLMNIPVDQSVVSESNTSVLGSGVSSKGGLGIVISPRSETASTKKGAAASSIIVFLCLITSLLSCWRLKE